MIRLTVFTPAYNRADLLPRCFEAMKRQTSKEFIWMIIDDGSTDGTRELVEGWMAQPLDFQIVYYYKENGGLHTAYNEAIAHIDTELCVCIDSDDFMPDDAVEKILTFWDANGSDRVAGIVGLDYDLEGRVIGDPLPDQPAVNLIDLLVGRYNLHNGDRTNVVRTELYKKYAPMESFPGEKNFNPHYMHLQISMIATDRAINKKYLTFAALVLVASLFHPYALMYLAVPFLTFRPWSYKTALMVGAFALLGISLQSLMGGLLNITDMMGEEYDAASFQGEGVNPFRLAAVSVPVILSFLARESIEKEKDRGQYLILNLSMLNAEIMFVGLFGTANYFARLANYFLPFQAISIPWLAGHFDLRSKRLITILAIVGYAFFFVYSFAIVEKFDLAYTSISFGEYLEILFQGV